MDDRYGSPSGNSPLQSVYTREDWPYKGVEDEMRDKDASNKPYGPFHVWVYQLGLNINSDPDLSYCHMLLCILNFAALHDNKIDDTRDFMGFFWWYTEKIRPLSALNTSEKRRNAYHDLMVRILNKTDWMVIDLFSPIGEIYSVMLFPGNYALSDYAAVKIKLERAYITLGSEPESDFVEYDGLKDLDGDFYESLNDKEIYDTYIQEFFLYELTPDNIASANGLEKFAVIKSPTNQKILLPFEFLCQLTWLSFTKLVQCFLDREGNAKNRKELSQILNLVNKKYNKGFSPDFALGLFNDYESLHTEQDFWKPFLEGIASIKPQDLDGPFNLHLYAFLLGAVLPEKTEQEQGGANASEEINVHEDEVSVFYNALCDKTDAEYTFSSLMEMFRELPFAVKYRGSEKPFIEKALTALIDGSKITKIREHTQKNITHFVVTKNLYPVFLRFIDLAREAMLKAYPKGLEENRVKNEDEFRLDLEKRVFNGFPVFYQFYVKKEFAEYVNGLLDKLPPDQAGSNKQRLFIASSRPPAFLPLAELLGISYQQFKTAPVSEAEIQTPSAPPPEEKGTAQIDTPAGNPSVIRVNETLIQQAAVESAPEVRSPAPVKSAKNSAAKEKPELPEQRQEPMDFLEFVLFILRKIGSGLKSLFGGLSKTLVIAMEKDLLKKNEMIEERKRKKNAPKPRKPESSRHTEVSPEKQNKTAREPEQDMEISLMAIAGNMIEDFIGSKLPLDEAIASLAALWNDPKTLKQDEAAYQKKENLVKIGTLIRNGIQGTTLKQANRAFIEERSQEIADYKQIEEMMKNLVQRKENKEVIRRYIALCIISVLTKK